MRLQIYHTISENVYSNVNLSRQKSCSGVREYKCKQVLQYYFQTFFLVDAFMTMGTNSVNEILVVRNCKQTFSCEFHVFTPARLRVSSFRDKTLRHCNRFRCFERSQFRPLQMMGPRPFERPVTDYVLTQHYIPDERNREIFSSSYRSQKSSALPKIFSQVAIYPDIKVGGQNADSASVW